MRPPPAVATCPMPLSGTWACPPVNGDIPGACLSFWAPLPLPTRPWDLVKSYQSQGRMLVTLVGGIIDQLQEGEKGLQRPATMSASSLWART